MNPLLGFILIEPSEIIIRIYQEVEQKNWQVLYEKKYPVIVQDAKLLETVKVIEVVSAVFADVSGLGVGEWKIVMRNVDQKIKRDLANAIEMKVDIITEDQEREFIFNELIQELK